MSIKCPVVKTKVMWCVLMFISQDMCNQCKQNVASLGRNSTRTLELIKERQHKVSSLIKSHNVSTERIEETFCFSTNILLTTLTHASSKVVMETQLELHLLECDIDLCSGKSDLIHKSYKIGIFYKSKVSQNCHQIVTSS